MSEPLWLTTKGILVIHAQQLDRHGGLEGCNDALLDSAMNRARQKFYYSDTTLPILAAAYGYGICRNHPFKDGNKRTALIALTLFLQKNGYDIDAPSVEKYLTIMQLAGGEMEEDALAAWIESKIVPFVRIKK